MSCTTEGIQPGRKCLLSVFHRFLKAYGKDLTLPRQGNMLDLAKASGRADSHSENQKNVKRTLKEAVAE